MEKNSECKYCNRAKGLNRCYENKDETSSEQKIFCEKNRDRIILQKQSNRCIQTRDLVLSYVELENRLKAMGEKFSVVHSKSI